MLERLDLVQDERDDALASFETTRFVNNVNLHWQFGNRFELGTQVGARYAKSTIDGARYSGWSTLLGFDVRRELTPVLDFGVHGTWLDSEAGGTTRALGRLRRRHHAPRATSGSRSATTSRASATSTSTRAATRPHGPYVRFRFKVDQDTFKDLDLSRLRVNNGGDDRSAAATPEPQQPTSGATLP